LRIRLGFIVARLSGFVFVVKMPNFKDFVRWRFVRVGMVRLLPRLLDFNQILPLCAFARLLVEGVRKCVLLIFEGLFVAAEDAIFIGVPLFVLSNFLKRGWEGVAPFSLSAFGRLKAVLSVYFKGCKGRIDHAVNYQCYNYIKILKGSINVKIIYKLSIFFTENFPVFVCLPFN
jgi:hypothetical protein